MNWILNLRQPIDDFSAISRCVLGFVLPLEICQDNFITLF